MNNQLAVTVFITKHLDNHEHYDKIKEMFKEQYNTEKVILHTGCSKDGIIITNLITNESTVL